MSQHLDNENLPSGPLVADPSEAPSVPAPHAVVDPEEPHRVRPLWVRAAMAVGRAASRWGWRLNLVLFLATLATTTLAGSILLAADDPARGLIGAALDHPVAFLLTGLWYSIPVILILGAHEMGHYLFCRYYGVSATLPYFIPAPHLFGTFGAVIRMRPPVPSRKALFDIGIAGPLAGFVVAVPLLAYGLATARIVHLPPGVYLSFADPPLFRIMAAGLGRNIPDGSSIESGVLHAVWFGLLMTAMNLFPVGQLDGGHVVFAISKKLHGFASRLTIMAMLALVAGGLITGLASLGSARASLARGIGIVGAIAIVGLYAFWRKLSPPIARLCTIILSALAAGAFVSGVFTPWLIWTVVLLLMGRSGHPPVQRADEPVGGLRIVLALTALIVFLLCFMPIPFEEVTLS